MGRIILFLFLSCYFSGTAQKAQIEKNVNYSKNGNTGTIKIRITYKVFVGEPVVNCVAKVVSHSGCKPRNFDVACNILQGGTVVANDYFSTVLVVDGSSPNWGEMWNVDAETAKNIFKQGFSLSGIQIKNIVFDGGCSDKNNSAGANGNNGVGSPEQIIQQKKAEIQKEKELAEQKRRQDEIKAQEDKWRREHELREQRKKEETKRFAERRANQSAEVKKIEAEEAARKREIEYKRKLYEQRKQQTQANMEDAAELSVAALLLHLYFGKLLYSAQNNDPTAAYQDFTSTLNTRFGYQISNHNLYINQVGRTYSSQSNTKIADMFSVDLNFGMEWNALNSEWLGFGIFGDLYAGHGLLFEHFKWGYNIGVTNRLGPVAYNYRLDGVEILHDSWIDANVSSKEKAKGQWGRHEIGASYRSENLNIDALYLVARNRPFFNDKKFSHGFRLEYFVPNGLRFYGEFTEVPKVLGKANGTPTNPDRIASMIKIGVMNNFNWYSNTYNNTYDKSVLFSHLKNKTWFLSMGLKTLGGNILLGDENPDTLVRTNRNINFQAVIEKEIPVVDNYHLSIGTGFSMFRGFNGYLKGSGGAVNNPIQLNNLNFSFISWDIPIGVVYVTPPIEFINSSVYASIKGDFNMPFYYTHFTEQDELGYGENQSNEFDGLKKRLHTTVRYELGLQYYISSSKKFRWGVLVESVGSNFKNGVNSAGVSYGLKASISL